MLSLQTIHFKGNIFPLPFMFSDVNAFVLRETTLWVGFLSTDRPHLPLDVLAVVIEAG